MASVLICDGQVNVDSEGQISCLYENGAQAWQMAPTESIFIAGIFEVPEVAELQLAFTTSFTLVMLIHLVSWAYGKLIHFAESENNPKS